MQLLNYREAAKILRCEPGSLRKKVMLGLVPHVKLFGKKGRTFFLSEDLEKFVLSKRHGDNAN